MAGVFTIPPDTSFVDALAKGVLDEAGASPQALLNYTILLPTRRACRALRDAFLRASDGASLLLPAMRPLGDVDEDELVLREMPDFGDHTVPPAIPGLRRRLLLARLILGWESTAGTVAVEQASQLAAELERLLDQVQTERLSFDGLKDLAPETYAVHWQKVLDFLKILTEHWPAIVDEQGGIDPAARRNQLLETLSRTWSESPPSGKVIAAGSTGTIPATADLLATIAVMPNGRVVLPGLMREADDETWGAIERDPSHPQHNLARLIDRLALKPSDVADWPHLDSRSNRSALIAEVMRPAETTQAWRALDSVPAGALDNVQRVDCADAAEEAGVIALILRQSLETTHKTAALVTPDRNLARRVAAELRRWDIEIDDSAGESLSATVPGSFLRLIVTMVDSGFAPAPLLSVLKHPLAAAGMAPVALRGMARTLERLVLRGPRPGAGIAGLRAALAAKTGAREDFVAVDAFLDRLGALTAPLTERFADGTCALRTLLESHVTVAEHLAATESEAGDTRLWAGDAGEVLARFFAELGEAAELLETVPAGSYGALLESLMLGATVRPRYGRHPRLTILGLLEARLQHADLVVLGGLNEGVWPPDPQPDPWLSRPMRERFGLPLPERRIGLTAHDFVQAFAAPEIILTRASKTDGQPTVPSRWLTRLDAVLRSAGSSEEFYPPASPWRDLRALLNKPKETIKIAPAAPCPPFDARPRQLSVTQVESWMRNPYAIYARHILRLRPLDPIDADPGAAERGTFIHDALDGFVKAYPGALPQDALAQLLKVGEDAFGDALSRPAVRAFWWPRFVRIAQWFIAQETERRHSLATSTSELSGTLTITGTAKPFVLSAKADRIDTLTEGGYEIIDYKTGAVPRRDDINLGFSPQLALEAAIMREGGFPALPAGSVRHLTYWRLSGGETAGGTHRLSGDADGLAEAALDGLRALVAAFDDPQTPYAATPRPDWAPRFNDYAHLARIHEWSSG
jgi:ATP-dependent helicase/nuclease subunit B